MARVKKDRRQRERRTLRRRKAEHRGADITFEEYLECVCAAHLACYVDSPFKERGGLFIVGPPSAFKTTFLEITETYYRDAVELSDINVQSLVDLRDQMASGVIRSLIVPDLGKLYERHPSTARNLEGHIRALAGEGFTAASFEDSRMNRLRARATILGAMTPKTQADNFKRWEDTGFSRRFLWSLVTLKDPRLQEEAVIRNELIDFGLRRAPPLPTTLTIPSKYVTPDMRRKLLETIRRQPGGAHATQLSLLSRMLAVLMWHYARTHSHRSALRTVLTFAQSFGETGATLTLSRKHG